MAEVDQSQVVPSLQGLHIRLEIVVVLLANRTVVVEVVVVEAVAVIACEVVKRCNCHSARSRSLGLHSALQVMRLALAC